MKHIFEKAITLALAVIFAFSGAALRALAQPAEGYFYFRDLASAVGGEDADYFDSALRDNSTKTTTMFVISAAKPSPTMLTTTKIMSATSAAKLSPTM